VPAHPSVLFLTGVTGLVGGELRDRLLAAQPDRHLVVLTRQRERLPELISMAGVEGLHGDMTHPHLGLDDCAYADLRKRVTEIIHCAADTRFGISLESARAVNTEGTRKVLELARDCRKLKKFAYVSTVYTAGRSSGHFLEGPFQHSSGFSNSYQQSKYEAEALVCQAMSELPAAIFRLSSVLGDSRTGVVRQFNYLHQLLRLFPRNMLPLAPGDPDAPVDLIASDWTMEALAYLFEFGFVPGRFYHICAGPRYSLTLRAMIDLTVSIFESHPLGLKWLPIRVPELVPLSRYEEFVEQRRLEGDRLLNELLRILGYFLPHLGIFQAFDNTNTMEALASEGLEFPHIGTYFGKVVQYCLETNWGRQTA
jgi:nucleoside-diphosphate-sugar epimerase